MLTTDVISLRMAPKGQRGEDRPWGLDPAFGVDSSMLRARARPVDYVVLRNPGGYAEGTGPSVAAGEHHALDVDWWRSIPLGADGVFAMEINAFHRYFAGTGGAD
jgi:hypothetical protein